MAADRFLLSHNTYDGSPFLYVPTCMNLQKRRSTVSEEYIQVFVTVLSTLSITDIMIL